MSKVAIQGNISGSGVLTIAAPNTDSDFTLTLPDTTAPILAGSGITLSASAPANTLVTNASGNVGFGTSSPSYKLDVNGFARGAIIHKKGTYTAGATTPSVSGVTYLFIENSSATTITNFTGGEEGQIIYLLFNDSNTTVNRSNCYLKDQTNFVSTSADTLVLLYNSPYWYEISRSNNG